jgi:chemotaxis response regulator CheB
MSTRILLARMPHMLRSIIRDIVSDEPDMEVVGELAGQARLLAAVEKTDASFVIIGHDGQDAPDTLGELFAYRPSARVLAVAREGRTGILYELRPQRIPIGELSASRLLAVIRGVDVAGRVDGRMELRVVTRRPRS